MGCNVRIKQGDITKETADFVVNASNTRLILGSGVSMALRHHCGHALQQEMNIVLAQHGGELSQGDVVATPCPKENNFRFVLHAAVMNYNKGVRGNKRNPSLKTIEKILHNIKTYMQEYAKEHEKVKVALPLLGCGVGGLEKRDVITLYREFFAREFSFSCEVVVYGYTREDAELIRHLFSPS